MRFLQVDYDFAVKERRITDDGTNWTGGLVRYESRGSTAGGPPCGWSVTLSFCPFRLELDLRISNASGASHSVAELHQLEGRAGLPACPHDLPESLRDAKVQRAEFERLAMALRASGQRFFRGDVTLWSDLAAQRERAAQDKEDRRRLFASEAAFKAKDWTQVVTLLEPASDRLSQAGVARLAYARKKLQGAT